MRRLLLFAFALTVAFGLSAATLARAASPVLVSPDVPTDETASGTTILPWQISEYDAAGPSYTLTFTVPGDPILDAIEKMDTPRDWLFSVEAASDLGASLTTFAEPRDVIEHHPRGADDAVHLLEQATLDGVQARVPFQVPIDVRGSIDGDARRQRREQARHARLVDHQQIGGLGSDGRK